MGRSSRTPYLLLALLLFLWTSLPISNANRLRSCAVAALSPAWNFADSLKCYLSDRPLPGNRREKPAKSSGLALENEMLKSQIELLKEWALYDDKINTAAKDELSSRRQYLADLIERQSRALAGRVIYRDPSSWSNSLWVGIGEEDNRAFGSQVICRNSPVVAGRSLIGVVDYVGKRQSRVRLITDSGLSPAVRVARDASIHKEIRELIDALSDRLQGKEESLKILAYLKETLGPTPTEAFLAKGELQGQGAVFWKSRPTLKGTGFNCDYPDAESPARDLRTGRPLTGAGLPTPLIQVGDHLITSGLDGIFPAGLSVAIVSYVKPLLEGGFSYDIEAVPTASNLNDLKVVFVLPPLSD